MSFEQEVIKEVTEDWLSCFENPNNQNGFMWRMTAQGILPDMVDEKDSRVIALIELAKSQLASN